MSTKDSKALHHGPEKWIVHFEERVYITRPEERIPQMTYKITNHGPGNAIVQLANARQFQLNKGTWQNFTSFAMSIRKDENDLNNTWAEGIYERIA